MSTSLHHCLCWLNKRLLYWHLHEKQHSRTFTLRISSFSKYWAWLPLDSHVHFQWQVCQLSSQGTLTEGIHKRKKLYIPGSPFFQRTTAVCLCVCACVGVCVCVCVCAWLCACMCACVHACVRACVRACVCVHGYVHACMGVRWEKKGYNWWINFAEFTWENIILHAAESIITYYGAGLVSISGWHGISDRYVSSVFHPFSRALTRRGRAALGKWLH